MRPGRLDDSIAAVDTPGDRHPIPPLENENSRSTGYITDPRETSASNRLAAA
jgi:hypothetical protein